MQYRSSLKSNERSAGSELITEINFFFRKYNLEMKKAVGELSLNTTNASDTRNATLFPDVIIFADENNMHPLMGWELKMPDVPINDHEFISNAKDKADRLGTGVFVLWNYQYVAIYIRLKDGSWPKTPNKIFSNYKEVFNKRKDVQNNPTLWLKQLEEVLLYLNKKMRDNLFKAAPIEFNIANYVNTISDKLAPITAMHYSKQSDITFRKYVDYWVENERAELDTVSNIKNDEQSYLLFAKNIIIKWVNRILFSHLIKEYHNGISDILYKFSKEGNIKDIAKLFNEEVKRTDFYTILSVDKYEIILPLEVVQSINEFNMFLSHTDFSSASMNFTAQLLENLVETSKRELMGLYTTPYNLAKLLVNLTVDKSDGEYGDLTTGSGTIAKILIEYVSKYNSLDYAHNHIWAADKYSYPLQIANLSMASPESINKKNIVFQQDALDLKVGNKISIVNPMSGENEILEIPKFNYLISNLPFISSNNRSKDERLKIEEYASSFSLDRKSDLYQVLLLKFSELLDNTTGRIGVITSNSWFKTQKNYNSFYKKLINFYDVKYIICSNVSRWFTNADIVTTMLILENKRNSEKNMTRFVSLNINPVTSTEVNIEKLSNSILFEQDSDLYNLERYSSQEVLNYINMGLSLEVLFDNVDWILDVKNSLTPMNQVFYSSRGVRTGGDKIFITNQKIVDDEYTFPILKNLSNIDSYEVTNAQNYYFYTRDSIEQIKNKGNEKTISYIDSVSSSPTALNRMNKKEMWYQADQAPQVADFTTSINPGKRFFWVKFNERTVVNQRVTAFRLKNKFMEDKELIHALLNTSISLFLLMGSGFGRGLGATDLTNDGISQSYFLNPELLSKKSKERILNAWALVKNKKIQSIEEQLNDRKWIDFNKIVYEEYNLDSFLFEKSKTNIIKLLQRRLSATMT